MHPTIDATMDANTDGRRRELRRLLEGMKAEPGRRQMAEAYRYIAIQRSIAVDEVVDHPVMRPAMRMR
jgi:hypothetical protein